MSYIDPIKMFAAAIPVIVLLIGINVPEALLGTVSTLATIALLVVYVGTRRDDGRTVARSIRGSLDVFCLILFVPYMYYWNLIGYRF